jgi:hypothetical protein
MSLTVNSVIRITDGSLDGIYRVIATPAGFDVVFLYRLHSLVECEAIDDQNVSRFQVSTCRSEKIIEIPLEVTKILVEAHQLEQVSLEIHPKFLRDVSTLTNREQAIYVARRNGECLIFCVQGACVAFCPSLLQQTPFHSIHLV